MSRRPVLPPAIFLLGPTACGKTDLAIAIAERLPVDIISVDSAMVYRDMDIGTAKPSPAELARAPHRLIDILDPAESYSAARFRADALREMAASTARGRIPLLVGGTMLYFRALEQGLAPLPEANPAVRQRIEDEAAQVGWETMHARLAAVDPAAAARIHPNDPQRLQRALEIHAVTGRPMSELWRDGAAEPLPYRLARLALVADRELLRRRIADRFHLMLERGFVAEVERLYRRGDLSPQHPSIRCVGYRQVWNYLVGEWDEPMMTEKAITATRQFAKRQFTWLRSTDNLIYLDSAQDGVVDNAFRALVQQGLIDGRGGVY